MKDRKVILRLRTALKLSVVVSLALFLGFHFQLGIPRWAAIIAALIIVVTALSTPGAIGLAPKFVIERSAEILLGVGGTVIAEILFLPRSAKREVESLTEQLFEAPYRIVRDLCLFPQTLLPMARWASLQRQSSRLGPIAGHLALENPHRYRAARLYRLSLALLTQVYALQRLLPQAPVPTQEEVAFVFAHEARGTEDWLYYTSQTGIPAELICWLGYMLRYRLLLRGVSAGMAAHPVEKKLLQKNETATLKSAERHFAFINGLRAFTASFAGALLWGWTGWSAGSSFMIIIAVMCSLVMCTPSPVRTALDFILGMLFSLPLGGCIFWLSSRQRSRACGCCYSASACWSLSLAGPGRNKFPG